MSTITAEIKDFVTTLKREPHGNGAHIKGLINSKSRFILNLPKYGIARRISNELMEGPFSTFYKYERTLAHKLHPLLYRYNMSFIVNRRIHNQFMRKYVHYRHLMPEKINRDRVELLREAVGEMIENDGHFMVLKFYDIILAKRDRALSRMLRAIEFRIINIKKNFTSKVDDNINIILKQYQYFMKRHKRDENSLFIERMKWDDVLKEYIPYMMRNQAQNLKKNRVLLQSRKDKKNINVDDLIDEEFTDRLEEIFEDSDEIQKSEKKDSIDEDTVNLSEAYERIVRNLLDKYSGRGKVGIEKLFNGMVENNTPITGKSKAVEVARGVFNIWMDDDSIPDDVKEMLRSVLDKNIS